MRMQALVQALYPPRCLGCEAVVVTDFGLCGACWHSMPFITGLVCDSCGLPLPGSEPEGTRVQCDDCLRHPPPWTRGRALALYDGLARQMILQLKHGDRLDLARPLGTWLAGAARPVLQPGMLVVPVPLHWLRLLKRRSNQSALLAARLARVLGLEHCPDLLRRIRATPSQGHRSRSQRLVNLAGALTPHPRRASLAHQRDILLIDDVMTSGATLAAATLALQAAGAASVTALVLARAQPGAKLPD